MDTRTEQTGPTRARPGHEPLPSATIEPKLRLAGGHEPGEQGATRRPQTTFALVLELGKPRITKLVAMTAAVGFALGLLVLPAGAWAWAGWGGALVVGLGCVLGTALSSGGANALNQCMEAARDARMVRTAGRPLPSGRIRPAHAWLAGGLLSIAGLLVLLALCGPAAAAVSGITIACYLLIYTPMKVLTPLNTWVGAVPGALPPLIGWCAAAWVGGAGQAGPWWAPLAQSGGWALFALMVVWQIPHFLAIAWMHKDDYARGGYKMLPLHDETGALTSAHMVAWAALLVPASLLPWLVVPGLLSLGYALVAAASSVAYLGLTLWLAASRTRARARAVFLASIVHLPLLLVALVGDAAVVAWLGR